MALLVKWMFNLLTKEGIWQTLLRRKYIGSNTLSWVSWKPRDSHFWAGLMAAKKYSFHMVLSLLRMERILDSERISGSEMPRFMNNSRYYKILCDTKVLRALRCSKSSHRMCCSGEEVSLGPNKNRGMPYCSIWVRSI
jgi:hypothetical protein